jgi:hypothetical protein
MVNPQLIALPTQNILATMISCRGDFCLESMYVLQPHLVGPAIANTKNRENLEAIRKYVHCESEEVEELKKRQRLNQENGIFEAVTSIPVGPFKQENGNFEAVMAIPIGSWFRP